MPELPTDATNSIEPVKAEHWKTKAKREREAGVSLPVVGPDGAEPFISWRDFCVQIAVQAVTSPSVAMVLAVSTDSDADIRAASATLYAKMRLYFNAIKGAHDLGVDLGLSRFDPFPKKTYPAPETKTAAFVGVKPNDVVAK